MSEFFYTNSTTLLRTLVLGVSAYAVLIVLLRISGKRTLAKMNAFDLIVTVALGSSLASVVTSKDVALAQGALAFFVLIAMQYLVSWLSIRSSIVRRAVKNEAALLVRKGEFLHGVMRRERVTEGEVLAAVRSAGVGSVSEVAAVILETDGTMSVIPDADGGSVEVLSDVHPSKTA